MGRNGPKSTPTSNRISNKNRHYFALYSPFSQFVEQACKSAAATKLKPG